MPYFYLLSLVKVSLPILLLLVCSLTRAALRLAFRRRWLRRSTRKQEKLLDRTEVLETVVFQFQLCSSWRNSYELVRSMARVVNAREASGDALVSISIAGGVLACVLFALQLIFMAKYLLAIYSMVLAQRVDAGAGKSTYDADDGTSGSGPPTPKKPPPSPASTVSSGMLRFTRRRLGHDRLSADRLKTRMHFIGKRFGDHGERGRAPMLWPHAFYALAPLTMYHYAHAFLLPDDHLPPVVCSAVLAV